MRVLSGAFFVTLLFAFNTQPVAAEPCALMCVKTYPRLECNDLGGNTYRCFQTGEHCAESKWFCVSPTPKGSPKDQKVTWHSGSQFPGQVKQPPRGSKVTYVRPKKAF